MLFARELSFLRGIATGRKGRRTDPAGLVPALLAGFLAGGLWLGGCASGKAALHPDADPSATIERLRSENAAQLRKQEELENQVFILNSELESRRGGEPPPAAVVPPPVLPEIKLQKGETTAASEGGSGPASLLDDAEVEYAGAAAERQIAKRPVLKLWGPGADDGGAGSVSDGGSDNATDSGARAMGDDGAGEPARPRERRRSALTRRPPRLAAIPAPAPAASAEVASPRVPAAPAEDPRAGAALYQDALAQLRAGRHEEAAAALRAFVTAHPHHDLADNAQYWLGECFYDRKDYSTALREFRRVVAAFPSGNKVPDALLKLGLSYLALGSARPGREALTDVVKRFPHHPAAALAEAKLAEIGAGNVATALGDAPGDAGADKPHKSLKEVR